MRCVCAHMCVYVCVHVCVMHGWVGAYVSERSCALMSTKSVSNREQPHLTVVLVVVLRPLHLGARLTRVYTGQVQLSGDHVSTDPLALERFGGPGCVCVSVCACVSVVCVGAYGSKRRR